MTSKTEQIKKVPIKDVVDRLKIDYKSAGQAEFAIIESGKITNGWRFNTEKNLVKDFSHGDRGEGDTFGFVKTFLDIDDAAVFEWFEKEFGIEQEQLAKNIYSLWKTLPKINESQQQYLKSRGIDPEKVDEFVKDYNGGIGCLIYEGAFAKGLMARTLHTEKDKRFVAATGYPTRGIYMHNIDKAKPYIIVVEGLIDFLSLRQFDTNVVGLKSAESGVEEVIKLAKEYKIYFLPDTDEAGKKTMEKMKGIKFKTYDWTVLDSDAKDVNDIIRDMQDGADYIIKFILDESREIAPINSTFDRMYQIQDIIRERGMLGIPGPFPEIDAYTSGMIPGSVYTIAAYSNTGKSKLAYHFVQDFLKRGYGVCYLSLEVSEWMTLKNIVQSHDGKTQQEFIAGHRTDQNAYSKLIIRDDIYKLDALCEYVRSIDSDVVVVDFVQNIQAKGTIYERNAAIAQAMQALAVETQKIFIDISQISNEQAQNISRSAGAVPTLKGAGEYFASSDVIMILYKQKDMSGVENMYLTITKNKYGFVNKNFLMNADLNKGTFSIDKEVQSEW